MGKAGAIASIVAALRARYGEIPALVTDPFAMILLENVLRLAVGVEQKGYSASYRSAVAATAGYATPASWRVRSAAGISLQPVAF